jgi:hypothetical protein
VEREIRRGNKDGITRMMPGTAAHCVYNPTELKDGIPRWRLFHTLEPLRL